MALDTLGRILEAGWRIEMHCGAVREHSMSRRKCPYNSPLHVETLVATRGRDFPFKRLAERLRCPRCGSRKATVLCHPAAEQAHKKPPEDLQFIVEETGKTGHVEVLARTSNPIVGHAALEGAARLRPGSDLLLRQGARVLSRSSTKAG